MEMVIERRISYVDGCMDINIKYIIAYILNADVGIG